MSGDGKNSESPTIERVFGLLDKWRHLPAYQLERRADVFFALFLPEVLNAHCGMETTWTLIPEFPLKKKENNGSNRADYLALSECGEHTFLVELKTDMASRSEKQDEYLHDAVGEGLHELIEGFLKICGATKEKAKYVHLLALLGELHLVKGVSEKFDQLYENAIPVDRIGKNWKGEAIRKGKQFANAFKNVGNNIPSGEKGRSLKVLYIQPESDSNDPNIIGFEKVANIVVNTNRGSKEIRNLFACYLKEWAKGNAGLPDPRTLHS